MKKLNVAAFILVVFALLSCGNSRENLRKDIGKMEKKMYDASAFAFDSAKGDSLLQMYTKFIEKYPDDTAGSKYLFNAASLSMTMQKNSEAISLFDNFIQKYPENPRTPACMFLKGFVYENNIHDIQKAKEIYLAFLEKFPENAYADDARNSLNYLGKTPEQMVAEFEKKQKEDSLKLAKKK